MFDAVIVVTDRTVLDGQLQKAIEQLETVAGVFAADHRRLRGLEVQAARRRAAGRQADHRRDPADVPVRAGGDPQEQGPRRERQFAIIADEAHSSQTGDAAKPEEGADQRPASDDDEDISRHRGRPGRRDGRPRRVARNLSFFAFTATPKAKTLELFGRDGCERRPAASFHLYSMKQAIEEGFILDVLQNYTTYDMAAQHRQHRDGHGCRGRGRRATRAAKGLMRWVRLHPHNIAQKVADHRRALPRQRRHLLDGQAKAMVVTGSRKEAVRYKLAIDTYIATRATRQTLSTLVAFSGAVDRPPSPGRNRSPRQP